MAEQFLTLMGDLDGDSQRRMAGWYGALREAGFVGTQTPGLPYHISLASFPPEKEREAVLSAEKAAAEFAPVPVHFSHMGLFAGGKVLFAAPENNPGLTTLHEACAADTEQPGPWTPHATVLIDEPESVHAALPVFVRSFAPFVGTIVRLHLCAFWPTREIVSAGLTGEFRPYSVSL